MNNDYRVYADSIRREMLSFVPESARMILDVGCSVGYFGEQLKTERSAEVWGVEIDKEAADIASGRLDRVFNRSFDRDLQLPEASFDCVVFNDVLEHMVDPYSALTYARELLKKDGCVVASIPNVRYFENVWNLLVKGTWEYTDIGILDRTHLRFFTMKSIRAMFCSLGYEIVTIEGINSVDWKAPRQRFRLIKLLLIRVIADMRWLQFAVVARPSN